MRMKSYIMNNSSCIKGQFISLTWLKVSKDALEGNSVSNQRKFLYNIGRNCRVDRVFRKRSKTLYGNTD